MRDDRGRTIDVHALRHTFGTLLSKGGVAPRTAQAAMRHSSIDLTMNTYTDPKLLDVQGALDSLPSLDWKSSPATERQMMRATGTDGRDTSANPRRPESAGATEKSFVAPDVAPDVGDRGQSVSFAVYASGNANGTARGHESDENSVKPKKKPHSQGLRMRREKGEIRGSNPRPSDPQSDALTN